MPITTDGFGTIVRNLGEAAGQWFFSEGGIQEPPFLAQDSRVIWQQEQGAGTAIENAGSDRFRLNGSESSVRQFRLVGNLGHVVGTVTYAWYCATLAPPALGRPGVFTSGVHVQDALAFVSVPPGMSLEVELRFIYVDNFTQIGKDDAAGRIVPSAYIELIG